MMAMSHADCDHPRTPAGRAACRKAGGPRPAGEHINGTWVTGPRLAEAHRQASPVVAVAPRGRRARTTPADLKRPGTKIRNIGDMPDVPHVFSNAIRRAWDEGWSVTVGDQFNEAERRILIVSHHGELALVWRNDRPHNAWGVFWRTNGRGPSCRILEAEVGIVAEGVRRLAEGE